MHLKVVIVDEHKLFRAGLASLISKFSDIEVIRDEPNTDNLPLNELDTLADVVLLDVSGANGFETLAQLVRGNKCIRILAISLHEGDSYIARALEAGASGYLHKGAEPEEVEHAIHTVVNNGFYFNEVTNKAMLKRLIKNRKINPSVAAQDLSLNSSELNVLKYLCQELTSSEIANKMYLSRRTVEGIRQHLITKTGARNVVGLVLFAARYGLIEMD
jgi:DNA-binding NarL/FixJ family response regulator